MPKGEPPSGMPSNAVLDARIRLNDPAHHAELRRLEAETMLNDLINNDDVISSYSPDDLRAAVDELHPSAPGVLNNYTLTRTNLRRLLQGNLTARCRKHGQISLRWLPDQFYRKHRLSLDQLNRSH